MPLHPDGAMRALEATSSHAPPLDFELVAERAHTFEKMLDKVGNTEDASGSPRSSKPGTPVVPEALARLPGQARLAEHKARKEKPPPFRSGVTAEQLTSIHAAALLYPDPKVVGPTEAGLRTDPLVMAYVKEHHDALPPTEDLTPEGLYSEEVELQRLRFLLKLPKTSHDERIDMIALKHGEVDDWTAIAAGIDALQLQQDEWERAVPAGSQERHGGGFIGAVKGGQAGNAGLPPIVIKPSPPPSRHSSSRPPTSGGSPLAPSGSGLTQADLDQMVNEEVRARYTHRRHVSDRYT